MCGLSYGMGYWLWTNSSGPHTLCLLLKKGDLCGWVWMMFPKETLLKLGMQSGCYTDPCSEVSLLLHCGQQVTSLLLLGLSAALQHWS